MRLFFKRFCVFAFLLFLSVVSNGQNPQIDSLNALLETLPQDTNRAKALIQLTFEYRNIDANKAIKVAQEARLLSQKLEYKTGLAQSTRNIALGYYKSGNYDTALIILDEAMIVAKEISSLGTQADILNTKGIIYFNTGNVARAIDAFEKNREIYTQLDRQTDLAGALSNIATIQKDQGNYTTALENYMKALEILEEIDYPDGQATVLSNIADLYDDLGEFDKAREYYRRTSALDSLTGNLTGIAFAHANIGDIFANTNQGQKALNYYHKAIYLYEKAGAGCATNSVLAQLSDFYLDEKKYDSAYYYINKSINLSKDCDNESLIIQDYTLLSKYYKALDNPSEAEKYLLSAYEKAQEIDLKPKIQSAANELYRFYRSENDFRSALYYQEIEDSLEHELFNDKKAREFARIEAEQQFNEEKRELEYAQKLELIEKDQEIQKRQSMQVFAIVGLIIALIIAIVVYHLYKTKEKSNQELEQRNSEIESINREIQERNEEIMQQRDQIEERNKLTERQRKELLRKNRDLVNLNEEKNALIGIVAHDLKSPIHQIKGLLNLIKMDNGQDSNPSSEYLDIIEQSSERAVSMVDRILDISSIENKKIELNMEEVNISKVFNNASENFKVRADQKNISLECNYCHIQDAVNIKTDKNLLLEAFENLISNAIKYSEKGKSVFLELEQDSDEVRFIVRDEGPGINKEDQDKLFLKYQSLTAKPTGGEKSTGLGLAIVRRYVEVMGGRVWCESEPGNGAAFIIALKNR